MLQNTLKSKDQGREEGGGGTPFVNYGYHCLFKTLERDQCHLSEVKELFSICYYIAGVLEVRLTTSIKHARY